MNFFIAKWKFNWFLGCCGLTPGLYSIQSTLEKVFYEIDGKKGFHSRGGGHHKLCPFLSVRVGHRYRGISPSPLH